MKLVGFIKEHANSLKEKQYPAFDDYNKRIYTELEKRKIESYLTCGSIIAVSMHVLKSMIPNDNRIVGALSYLTDGEWVWPSYLVFYLKNYDLEIDKEFLSKIFICDKMPYTVNEQNKLEAIMYLQKE